MLSKRLQAIYDLVDTESVVFDIGSDHGKLIKALIDNKKISRGAANENKKGPYLRLKEALKDYTNIKVLFSDGLDILDEEVDTLILAGMGGHLIIDILTKHKDKLDQIKTIICDAHNDLEFIRKSIINLGFNIIDESIIYERKVYYEIIKFVKDDNKIIYDDLDLKYGPILIKKQDDIFKLKHQQRLNKIDELLKIEELDAISKSKLLTEQNQIKEIIK